MKLTQEQASMVATAMFDGFADSQRSLCCAVDADEACAAIVGIRKAGALQEWVFDTLGCHETAPEWQQIWLDEITTLIEVTK